MTTQPNADFELTPAALDGTEAVCLFNPHCTSLADVLRRTEADRVNVGVIPFAELVRECGGIICKVDSLGRDKLVQEQI